MKIFWFDLETTGLSVIKNDIIELACMVEIDKKIVETKVWKMQPTNYNDINEEALQVNGLTIHEIKKFQPAPGAFLEILAFLNTYIDKYDRNDKFYLAGYNINKFDIGFFRQFFKKNNEKYFGSYFYPYCLDVYMLFVAYIYMTGNNISASSWKLKDMAQFFGVEVDNTQLHQALYDIELTRKLFFKLSEKFGFSVPSDAYNTFVKDIPIEKVLLEEKEEEFDDDIPF